jgi:hypothetical protein
MFFVANVQTACGTVNESTVILLRYAGFCARLMHLGFKPDKYVSEVTGLKRS